MKTSIPGSERIQTGKNQILSHPNGLGKERLEPPVVRRRNGNPPAHLCQREYAAALIFLCVEAVYHPADAFFLVLLQIPEFRDQRFLLTGQGLSLIHI